MTKNNECETPIEDLIDLGAASVETKGNHVSGIDNEFQQLPNTMGLIAD